MDAEDADIVIDGMALSRGFVNCLKWLWLLSAVALMLLIFGVVTNDYLLLLVVLAVAAILTVAQHRTQSTSD